MSTSFLSDQELQAIGFRSFGRNCQVSRYARFYGAASMSMEDNVRIDDFAVLSGTIALGNYIHIASHCVLHGGSDAAGISMEDFSGLSARVSVYAHSDDYSGLWLTNPTVPNELTNVISRNVSIGRHAIIGTGSVLLPGVIVGEGAALGAMSLATKSLEPFTIYAGNPARRLKSRQRDFLLHEKKLEERL
ncbi:MULTISPECIES: acyltransferase [unclassified Rhizobium]|uniref:acyltransferase n=1 Tax=unclassified Rhizobium TaxID=2613769 RepID=UPI003826DA98